MSEQETAKDRPNMGDLDEQALFYHRYPKPGKLAIQATKTLGNQRDLALAYSPGVGAQSSDVFPDYGFMLVQGETARASIPAFYAAVDAIAATLRDTPPEEDELNRAKLPAIERLRLSQATNEYWLAQLADVAEDPSEVEQTVNHIAVLEAVTPQDIKRLAQKYLTDSTAVRVQVISANAEADAE